MRSVMCGVRVLLGLGLAGWMVGCEYAPTEGVRHEAPTRLGPPAPGDVEMGTAVTLVSGREMWLRPMRLHPGGGSVEILDRDSAYRIVVTRRIDAKGLVEEFQYELTQLEAQGEQLVVRVGKRGSPREPNTWLCWTERPGESLWMRSRELGNGRVELGVGHRLGRVVRSLELSPLEESRLDRDRDYRSRKLSRPIQEFTAPVFAGAGDDLTLFQEMLALSELEAEFAEAVAEAGVVATAGGCPGWLKSAAYFAALACKGIGVPIPGVQAPAAAFCIAGIGITIGCHLTEVLLPFVDELPMPEAMEPTGSNDGGDEGGEHSWIWW